MLSCFVLFCSVVHSSGAGNPDMIKGIEGCGLRRKEELAPQQHFCGVPCVHPYFTRASTHENVENVKPSSG